MKIVFWDQLSTLERKAILQRSIMKNDALSEQVKEIVDQVKIAGDEALLRLTEKYDKTKIDKIIVSDQEYSDAYDRIDEVTLAAIRFSIQRIKAYTQAQLPENWVFDSGDGILCGRQARAIASVGLYVPGGTAPLVSSVMMLAIPAFVVGCEQRLLCTPPSSDGGVPPSILVAAKECGVQQVYKVGGAQAIAAMAYGTQSISKVDKIFGPGNQWVTKAKQLCAQNELVSIDLPAGPSELLIIADKGSNPNFIAADLLSQAEHDTASQVFLITPAEELAEAVSVCLKQQLKVLPRSNIAEKALENGKIIIVNNLMNAFEVSNNYAPEHLSIQVVEPEQYLSKVNNAGTVFLGPWAAESLGDYNTGANHVLPTAGLTRTLSGLSVNDFVKWIGFQQVSRKGLEKIGPNAMQLAHIEQLKGHENAIKVRLNEEKCNAKISTN
jgi:histidinol dehydrogenase